MLVQEQSFDKLKAIVQDIVLFIIITLPLKAFVALKEGAWQERCAALKDTKKQLAGTAMKRKI